MQVITPRFSGVVARAGVALVLWAGLPGFGCVCADGSLRLLCELTDHENTPAARAAANARDCCKKPTAQAARSCCDRTSAGGARIEHGCKRVTKSQTDATRATEASFAAQDTLALPGDSIDLTVALSQYRVPAAAHGGVGPPPDLVITLRSILI